jgi:lysophospholipase L1-like esterase
MNRFSVVVVLLILSLAANGILVLKKISHLLSDFPAKESATIPEAFDSGIYYGLCQRFQKLPATHCHLLVVGDSIPSGMIDDLLDKNNNGDLPEEWLPILQGHVLSRCIPGVTSIGLRKMADTTPMPMADEILLWFGINDISMGHPLSGTEENYRAILTKFRSVEPQSRIIIAGVLPTYGQRNHDTIRDLDVYLVGLAKETGSQFIDLSPGLEDAQGHFDPALTRDGTHPNAAGLIRIEALLEPVVK